MVTVPICYRIILVTGKRFLACTVLAFGLMMVAAVNCEGQVPDTQITADNFRLHVFTGDVAFAFHDEGYVAAWEIVDCSGWYIGDDTGLKLVISSGLEPANYRFELIAQYDPVDAVNTTVQSKHTPCEASVIQVAVHSLGFGAQGDFRLQDLPRDNESWTLNGVFTERQEDLESEDTAVFGRIGPIEMTKLESESELASKMKLHSTTALTYLKLSNPSGNSDAQTESSSSESRWLTIALMCGAAILLLAVAVVARRKRVNQ